MTFQEAVVKLEEIMGSEMVSFESNEQLNGWDRYEFVVLRPDGLKVMVHVGVDGHLIKGVTG